jgi:DNA repair protein RecO (recombination protein O)
MKTLKVRALVIKEYETGEADKRLLLLCKEHGRMMVYARGARKPKSKFMAAAQMFTYSDLVLAQGRGFYSMAQAEVLENFYSLREDYDRLLAAYAITNICDKTILENSNCDELLQLALKSLSLLSKGKLPPAQIVAVFLFRFFDFYGYRPHSQECAVCEAVYDFDDLVKRVNWNAEGVLCVTCADKTPSTLKISPPTLAAISYILNSELPQSFQFTVHENVLAELQSAAQIILNFHFSEASTTKNQVVSTIE